MNLCTISITNYVRGDDDWVVEVSYKDFAFKPKMRPIGVSRDVQTQEDAVSRALNSLRKSCRRDGWILPPQIFSCIPKRRKDWHNKYPKNRVTRN